MNKSYADLPELREQIRALLPANICELSGHSPNAIKFRLPAT